VPYGCQAAFVLGSGTAAVWAMAEGVRFDSRVRPVVSVLTWWTTLATCTSPTSEAALKVVILLVSLMDNINVWPMLETSALPWRVIGFLVVIRVVVTLAPPFWSSVAALRTLLSALADDTFAAYLPRLFLTARRRNCANDKTQPREGLCPAALVPPKTNPI
jgi:hypothetical protein